MRGADYFFKNPPQPGLQFPKQKLHFTRQTHNADRDEHNKQHRGMTMNAAALEGFRMIADQMLGTPVVTVEELDAKMQQKFTELDAKLAKLKAMMIEG